jgi:translation initiation factor IF-1
MKLLETTNRPEIAGVIRGTVVDIGSERILVRLADGQMAECDMMGAMGRAPLDLLPDDVVIVLKAVEPDRAVVLGRIAGSSTRPSVPPPDELVIEARTSLTLRVGDGSITIREDGRILIKGKELVSHAKGMNRIRGGSVAIN